MKQQILIIKNGELLATRSLPQWREEVQEMLLEADKRDASIGEYVEWIDFGERR